MISEAPDTRTTSATQCSLLVGIFVGGRGSRMGGRKKGLLPTRAPGSPPILMRLLRTIQQALGPVPVVLVGNSDGYAQFALPTVEDAPAQVGPLGGLNGLLLHAHTLGASQIIALACDLPYLTAEVLLGLVRHDATAAAVAPLAGSGLFEPLIARYSVDFALTASAEALANDRHSLQAVLSALRCQPLALTAAARHSLRDWDRPEDMQPTESAPAHERRMAALGERIQALKSYRQTCNWSWQKDSGEFERITLPASWDGTGTTVCFRTSFDVPTSIHGIPVAGASVKLYSHFTTVTTSIRIDGELRFREQYWTDFRLPEVIVTNAAQPGQTHGVELECEPFGGSAGMVPLDFMISSVESALRSLETVVEAIAMVHGLDPEVAERALNELETCAFSWPDLEQAQERARAILLPLSPILKQRRVFALGQCHIDLNFLWPMADTVRTVVSSYTAICDMLDEFPELCFTHTQAATYEILEQHDPALLERIEVHAKAGRWEVLAATWTEGDTNLPSGEALIRQFVVGQSTCERRFGTQAKVAWYPDAFGHSFNLPQILRGVGIEHYFFWRCGDQSQPLFRWRGIDGSEVTAFNSDYYLRQVSAPRVGKFSRLLAERFSILESPYVFGVGNHGGGPSREDIQELQKLNADPLMPTIEFARTASYFANAATHQANLPVIERELNFVFDAAYSSHADMKWHTRTCESLLYTCEALGALFAPAIPYPRAELDRAWKHKLFNDFHDFVGGTSIREAYDYGLARAVEVEDFAESAIQARLREVAPLPATEEAAGCVAVFNSLPWSRTAVVEVNDCPKGIVAARSESGQALPVQYLNDSTLMFVAPELAPTGVSRFQLETQSASSSESQASLQPTLNAETRTLENEFLRLTLLPDGSIKTLLDKRTGQPILHTQDSLDIPVCFSDYAEVTRPYANNALLVQHELPVEGSAWFLGRSRGQTQLYSPTELSFQAGPVMVSAVVSYRYKESNLRQELRLYTGIPWVDVRHEIDWREQGNRDTGTDILRVTFSPLVKNGRAHFEIPCGSLEREAAGREVPTQRWLDLSNDHGGFALLNNAKYGCSAEGRTLRLTLIRSAYWPDATSDVGTHTFAYGLYPHSGNFAGSDVVRRGMEFNQPVHAVRLPNPGHPTPAISPRPLPQLAISPQNIVVSCLKLAEASDALVLRVYEAHGLPTQGSLRITPAPRHVEVVNLLEKSAPSDAIAVTLSGETLTFSLRPYEILTLKWETA